MLFRSDQYFGAQEEPRILLYAGLETQNIEDYIAITNLYGKRKTYKFGEIKTAIAKFPGTQEIVYEVVYIDIIDPNNTKGKDSCDDLDLNKAYYHTTDYTPLITNDDFYDREDDYYDSEPYEILIDTRSLSVDEVLPLHGLFSVETRENGIVSYQLYGGLSILSHLGNELSVPLTIGTNTNYKIRPKHPNVVTADFNLYTADAVYKNLKTISSIDHMRDEFNKLGDTDKNFLPLWMQTPQDTIEELGYIPALVLCYCKPGTSAEVERQLRGRNINFKQFHLDIDRLIIDRTKENPNDQYIVFQNKEYVV